MPPHNLQKRINCHGHLLPNPEQIPRFMRERKIFWIDDARSFMYQGDWSRPITDPSFFVDQKIEWMDRNNIDTTVILNLSQLYCNGYERSLAQDVIRFQNDFNASVQHTYGHRFIAGFVVQPLYVDDALMEIERCVHSLGMPVLCLPTHFLNHHNKWVSIADDTVKPIFELANQYKLAIEIHPYQAEDIVALDDQFWRFHLIWMCAQTADAYHMYTMKNFDFIYPDIRVCFAHGNQFGQMGYGRSSQGFVGRPDLFPGASHPKEHLSQNNLFYDTLVHDLLSFELVLKRQGHQQIVIGIDDPYPLGEMENHHGCYPGKLVDDALKEGILTQTQADEIWGKNAMKWIWGK